MHNLRASEAGAQVLRRSTAWSKAHFGRPDLALAAPAEEITCVILLPLPNGR